MPKPGEYEVAGYNERNSEYDGPYLDSVVASEKFQHAGSSELRSKAKKENAKKKAIPRKKATPAKKTVAAKKTAAKKA